MARAGARQASGHHVHPDADGPAPAVEDRIYRPEFAAGRLLSRPSPSTPGSCWPASTPCCAGRARRSDRAGARQYFPGLSPPAALVLRRRTASRLSAREFDVMRLLLQARRARYCRRKRPCWRGCGATIPTQWKTMWRSMWAFCRKSSAQHQFQCAHRGRPASGVSSGGERKHDYAD